MHFALMILEYIPEESTHHGCFSASRHPFNPIGFACCINLCCINWWASYHSFNIITKGIKHYALIKELGEIIHSGIMPILPIRTYVSVDTDCCWSLSGDGSEKNVTTTLRLCYTTLRLCYTTYRLCYTTYRLCYTTYIYRWCCTTGSVTLPTGFVTLHTRSVCPYIPTYIFIA